MREEENTHTHTHNAALGARARADRVVARPPPARRHGGRRVRAGDRAGGRSGRRPGGAGGGRTPAGGGGRGRGRRARAAARAGADATPSLPDDEIDVWTAWEEELVEAALAEEAAAAEAEDAAELAALVAAHAASGDARAHGDRGASPPPPPPAAVAAGACPVCPTGRLDATRDGGLVCGGVCGATVRAAHAGTPATFNDLATRVAAAETAHAATGCGAPPARMVAGGTLFLTCGVCGCVEAVL